MENTGPLLLTQKKDHTLILSLNRPEVMNCINVDLLSMLHKTFRDLESQKDIRALIITGSGEKAFCAGADLKERISMPPEAVKNFITTIRDTFTAIQNLPIPVICAVNGIALGGGTELALSADIRIASEKAVMGLTETRLAIIPGAGGTQRLPRLVGIAKAKELIFTGRKIDADQALAIGLVNQVTKPEDLMSSCLNMAEEICSNGPIAVEMAKYAIDKGMQTDLATGLAIESNAYRITIPTKDRMEGLKAFREKRQPVYRGE